MPSADEMLAALASSTTNEFGVTPKGEVRGLVWGTAVHLIQTRLKTTAKKAEEWLLVRGTEEDSPFVLLRTSGYLVARTGPEEWRGSTNVEGWTETDRHDASFDKYGRPLLPGVVGDPRSIDFTVLRRSSLPTLLAAIRKARAAKDADTATREGAKRREFYGHHSEAMAVIEPWLADLDRSEVNEVARMDPPFEISNHDTERFWGSPKGILTITLRGSEIAAFAALIEKTRKGS